MTIAGTQGDLGDAGGAARPAPIARAGAHPFEIWISNTLRIGVVISGAIFLAGIGFFFWRGTSSGHPASLHELVNTPSTAVSLREIWRDTLRAHPSAIIRLGIIALILTPVIRVAMTAVLFVHERDWIFLGIVVVVFAILLVGLTGLVG